MADLTIKDVRAKFPQYDDLDDQSLADALHGKFYADMPKPDFYAKIGFVPQNAPKGAFPSQPLEMATPPRSPRTTPAQPTAPTVPTAGPTASGSPTAPVAPEIPAEYVAGPTVSGLPSGPAVRVEVDGIPFDVFSDGRVVNTRTNKEVPQTEETRGLRGMLTQGVAWGMGTPVDSGVAGPAYVPPQTPAPTSVQPAPEPLSVLAGLLAPQAADTIPQISQPTTNGPRPTGGAIGLAEMMATGAGAVPFRPNGPIPVGQDDGLTTNSVPKPAPKPAVAAAIPQPQTPKVKPDLTDDARAARGFGRSAYMSDGTEPQLGQGGSSIEEQLVAAMAGATGKPQGGRYSIPITAQGPNGQRVVLNKKMEWVPLGAESPFAHPDIGSALFNAPEPPNGFELSKDVVSALDRQEIDYNPEGTGVSRALERGWIGLKSTGPAWTAKESAKAIEEAQVGLGTIGGQIAEAEYLEAQAKALRAEIANVQADDPDAALSLLDEIAGLEARAQQARIGATTSTAMGYQEGRDQAAVAATEKGVRALIRLGELSREREAIPFSPRAERVRRKLAGAENTVEATMAVLAENPTDTAIFIGEIGAESTPQIVASAISAIATRNPALVTAIMGGGTFSQEYGASVSEFLQENKVSLNTPEEAAAVIKNADLMRKANKRGLTRAITIAAMEAIGFGATTAISKTMGPIGGAVASTGVGMATGGGGESLARAMSGQEQSAQDIILEAAAEGLMGTAELGVAAATTRGSKKGGNDEEPPSAPRNPPAAPQPLNPAPTVQPKPDTLEAAMTPDPAPKVDQSARSLEGALNNIREFVRRVDGGAIVVGSRADFEMQRLEREAERAGATPDEIDAAFSGRPAPTPDPAPKVDQSAPEVAPRIEIMDETETVDGETRPTGRKVRVNLDTGEVSPLDPDAPASDQSTVVQDRPQDTSAVGSGAEPAAGTAQDDAEGDAAASTIRTATLSSEEVGRIQTDAKTFQYKDNGDQDGVTDRLQDVPDWDQRSAMGGIVYEYADGRRVVADGHQRLGLAKRLQAQGKQTPWNVEIIREVDGFTPADVRRIAALKNIREGSGTAIDAAKVLREAPNDIESLNLPPRSALVRDAKGLAKLSDDAFGMVVNEVVSPEWGAAVGQNVPDANLHADVISLLKKVNPKNNDQAAMIARQAAQDTVTETQTSLFGDEQISQNLYLERARVLDAALKRLKKDKATFKVLSDRADTITSAGNVLNSEANAARVEQDGKVQAYLNAEANRKGPISDALTAAATDLKANPKAGGRIVTEFLKAVRDAGAEPQGVRPDRAEPDAQGGSRPQDVQADNVGRQPDTNLFGDTETAGAEPEQTGPDLFGDDAPQQTRAPDRAEADAIAQQGKIRRLDGNTGDAGPLFDDQPDMLDGQTEDAGTAGTYVNRDPDGYTNDRLFKDRSDELPDRIAPDKIASEMKRLTLESGRERGVEHLALVDADGQIISYGSGHESGTGVPAALYLSMDPSERIVAHHNHPGSSAFSPADYSLALGLGMESVYAHGHDGSVFRVTATDVGRGMWWTDSDTGTDASVIRSGRAKSQIDTAWRNLWLRAQDTLLRVLSEKGLDTESSEATQYSRDHGIVVMMAMRDAGIIEVDVTGPAADRMSPDKNVFLVEPDLKKLYDNLVRDLKKQAKNAKTGAPYDRRTFTDRHPADLGSAPDGNAGASQGVGAGAGSGQGDVSDAGGTRQKGDRGQKVRQDDVTGDADFDGALDDVFGSEAEASATTSPQPQPSSPETFRNWRNSVPSTGTARGWTVFDDTDVGSGWVLMSKNQRVGPFPSEAEARAWAAGNAAQEGSTTSTPKPAPSPAVKPSRSKADIAPPWVIEESADAKPENRFKVMRGAGDNSRDVWGYYATRAEAENGRQGALEGDPGDILLKDINRVLKEYNRDTPTYYGKAGIDIDLDVLPDSDVQITITKRTTRQKGRAKETREKQHRLLYSDVKAYLTNEAEAAIQATFRAPTSSPAAKPKRPAADIAKDMKNILRGLKESGDLFGDTPQPQRTMTQAERAELEARAKQSKMRTSKPQKDAGPLFGEQDDLFGGLEESAPQSYLEQMDVLNGIAPGWTSSPNGMLTNPDTNGGIIDKAQAGDWFIVFGNGWEVFDGLPSRAEAVAEFARSMQTGTDPTRYRQLAPLFVEALDGIDPAQNDRRGTFVAMVRPLADAGLERSDIVALKPYFDRFLDDVESGIINLEGEPADAPSGSDNLESDRGDTTAGDGMGGTDVPASGRPDGRGTAGGTGASGGSGGRSSGRGGVSSGNAAGVGGRGDQGVSGENGAAPGVADGGDRAGSGDTRKQRLPDDNQPDQDTTQNATDAPGGVADRRAAQREADRKKVVFNDEQNIRDTLPLLMPEQQDDVVLIERRFAKEDGHGMLLTNGTGTGKTYSGGGVIKRMVQAGKDNILIIAPDDGIMNAWIAMGEDLGIPITKLADTKDAGSGVVVTTYANAGVNDALATRDWDLVVTDEAHKLSQNAAGDSTKALDALRTITNRPQDRYRRGYMVYRKDWDRWKAMPDGDKKSALLADLRARNEKLAAEYETKPRSKVLFLSATPFSYDKTLDYAEGYLFNYGADGVTDNGSRQDGRAFFFVQNFGYRIRYHKLTKPEGAVDNSIFEREMHERLKREGALAGRSLTVSTDYDRKFVATQSRIGDAIDAAFDYLWKNRPKDQKGAAAHDALQKAINANFKHHHRMQLLEAIKAEAAVADIREHLKMGRKVVVFHDFNKGGGLNPFQVRHLLPDDAAVAAFDKFMAANPIIAETDFRSMRSPLQVMRAEFGSEAAFYNGTEKKADRKAAIEKFNDDDSGTNLIVVQADAGSAGISLHDTTGQRQRVLINLGMPPKPTTALQEEGRIRRVGVKTNAPFRYYTIGTTWERNAFADKIAGRSGTVENLALGNDARAIRDSFIDAYAAADRNPPSETDGTGGIEADRVDHRTSPFDKAKTHYFGRMKTTGRRDQRKGLDFYATPEPLGYMMVNWSGMRANEKVLEPSVGDGSIGRYFPEHVDATIIDPSMDLLSTARLRVPGARAEHSQFESHHIVNKYDVVVMNPPFGTGGKMAMDHLAKAMKHVRPGGRVVALIPTGPAADKQFQKMFEAEGFPITEWNFTADIALPSVTFEKAGTNVAAHVVVFDRVMDPDRMTPTKNINMTGAKTINEFFDRLEGIAVPARPEVSQAEINAASTVSPPVSGEAGAVELITFTSKKGKEFPAVAYAQRVDRDTWGRLADIAKSHDGFAPRMRRGKGAGPVYAFRSDEAREAFIEDTQKVQISFEEPAYHGSPHDFDRFSTDAMGTGEGNQAFGWGMYFASLRQVADSYRKGLSRPKVALDGTDVGELELGWMSAEKADKWAKWVADADVKRPDGLTDQVWRGAQTLLRYSVPSTLNRAWDKVQYDRMSIADALDSIEIHSRHELEKDTSPANQMELAARIAAVQALRPRVTSNHGRLYQVELPDVENLLDWDQPLANNSQKVQDAIATLPYAPDKSTWGTFTGQDLYEQIRVEMMGDDAFLANSSRRAQLRAEAAKSVSLALKSVGIPGHRYLDGVSRNKPLNDIKREFLDELAEDAEFEDVMSMIGTGTFSPTNERILMALEADDWLGFDYPAQAISAALSSRIGNYDASEELMSAIAEAQGGGSHNYVIYDENAVEIVAKERRGVAAAEAISDVMPALRAELDRLNLKRVHLGKDTRGGRLGAFVAAQDRLEILIAPALDPEATLHHEALHAMRAMNLFTAAEWAALEAKAVRTWMKQYDIAARYPDLLPSEQIEEAIAEAFADAAKTRTAPKGSLLVQAFNKIARLLKAIGNALRGAGFQTVEDVFGRALSGEIGARDTGAGFQETMREARFPRRQTAQQRAHQATAMGANGGSVHIPDRRIWEELTASNAGIWDRLKGGAAAAHDWADKARIKVQDRFLPVLRAQEAIVRATGQPLPEEHNAYLAEETFSGKVGRHLFEIDEDYTKAIIDIMAGQKGEAMLDAETVGTWLYARHAQERNARIASINPNMPDGGSGMTNADAAQILATASASPDAARLQRIGDLIDDLRERTLRLREDAGLITPQEAQIWRTQYKHYVPLKGFVETDHSEAMLDVTGIGRRFNTRGAESKRALGRRSEAFNPLQAAITQAQEVAIRAEKNRVGQRLHKLAKDFPSRRLWSVKKPAQKRYFNRTTGLVETRVEDPVSLFLEPNEMAVKINGQEHRILFHDARLAQAAGTVGADQMGWFIGLMSKASRFFSSVNTMLDPEFVVRNAFRDMTAAQINIRNFGKDERNAIAKAMIKNWPKAFAGAFRGQANKADSEWTRYYREFEKSGAKVSFWKLEQPEADKKDLARRVKLAGGNVAQRASRFLRFSTRDNPVLGFIERTNLAVDNAVRLAAYVEARKRGWSKAEAASLSKNLTVNFNRRGEWGATINALYPFANAGIQGTQILFRAMTSKRMAKYALGGVMLGAILDQVNASLSEEDDDGELAYDKIPDWKNQMNMVVMLGPDGGSAATLWLPYGYNLFPYLGQQVSKVARGVKSPGDAMADYAAAMFGSFSPLGGRDLQSVLTPTMLDPINEMAMNEDWLGRPIRPESPYADFGPDAYKFFGGVSTAARVTADALNRGTGGTIAEPGMIDVSPEYIDHAFGFVTGGAGRFIGRMADVMGKLASGEVEEIEARNIPFYRSLQYQTGDYLDRERYYRFRQEVKEAQDALKTYQEVRQPVPDHVRSLARLYKPSGEADKTLRKLRQARMAIEDNPNLTAAEKSERRARLDERAARVYLQFNKMFLRSQGPQGE